MASNRLEDLNDMLFNQLVRLDEDDIEQDKLDKEIKRSQAMNGVANNIIQNAQVVLSAAKFKDNALNANTVVPRMLGIENNGKK